MKTKTVLMIGDSITAGFDVMRYFPEDIILNKGVSGDSTVECLHRIESEWFLEKPDTVFVCIGTNDFARERTDQFVLDNIHQIIEKIRQYGDNTEIYLTSIFPTRDNEPRPNDRIKEFNKKLEVKAIELGCTYFDLNRHFTDDQGMLKKEFTDDGLHLTEEGYKQWSIVLSNVLRGGLTNREILKKI